MGKQWNPGQEKKFVRELKLNKKYYTVRDQATNLAPWRDAKTYDVHVFTERSGLTAVPRTAGGTSAIQVCRSGPVYDEPPAGIRNVADGDRQVDGPLGDRPNRRLTRAEIRELEGQVAEMNDDPDRSRHTRRGLGGFWNM